MKNCPHCNAQVADSASFCTSCGKPIAAAAPAQQPQPVKQNFNQQPPQMNNRPPQQAPYQPQPQPAVNAFDHTDEFSAEEMHDNKIFALAGYALGIFGIIVALLATSGKPSEYLRFHIKQSLMISIMSALVCLVYIIPCLGWFVGTVCLGILVVVDVICFINTCTGKSVEAPIIRNFGFLK